MAADRRRRRQFQILLLLRARETVSAAELAERLDVTVRTVYRDIEELLQNQMPIQGVPGPEGGYRLRPEAALDPMVFDSEDALDLYLLQSMRRGEAEAEIVEAIAEAGDSTAENARVLLERKLYFDPDDTYWRDEGSGLVPEVRRALIASEAINARWSNQSFAGRPAGHEEVLVPLGLVWKAGHWYIVARGLDGAIFRERLAHLARVERTGLSFVAPQDFSLESWWRDEMERFGKGDVKVVFLADRAAAQELRRLNLKKESEVEEFEDGGLRISLYVDDWRWLVPLLAAFGPSVVVQEPDALRSELLATFQHSIARYEAGVPEDHGLGESGGDARLRSTRGRPK